MWENPRIRKRREKLVPSSSTFWPVEENGTFFSDPGEICSKFRYVEENGTFFSLDPSPAFFLRADWV